MTSRTFGFGLLTVLFFLSFQTNGQIALPRYEEHLVKAKETPATICKDYNIKVKDFLLLNDFPPTVKLSEGQVVLIRPLKEGEKGREDIEAEKAESAAAASSTESKPANPPVAESKPMAPKKAEKAPGAKNPRETKQPSAERESRPETKKPEGVPSSSNSATVGPGGITYTISTTGYHVVEKGQTFYRIALIYGLSMDKLKALNNMGDYSIHVGQKLKVSK